MQPWSRVAIVSNLLAQDTQPSLSPSLFATLTTGKFVFTRISLISLADENFQTEIPLDDIGDVAN